jgi:molybdopterin-containing oxidoreductase family membrane subunit
MRDIGTMGGAAWGLYIAFVVYFIGVSFAGITVAALIRLLNLERLKPIARMAEVLTVIALILGAFSILVDLGQPARGIINLFRYARPQSPFFGTFSLVISGYLFASLVYLYLDGRRDAALSAQRPGRLQSFYRLWAAGYRDTPGERKRHAHTSWWLALSILPMLVIAHSTLGLIFGIQPGRPGWFSALQAPGFLVLAGISGIGLLIIIGALVRQALGLKDQLNIAIFRWLGNFLLILTLVYLYFLAVEFLTVNYGGQLSEGSVSQALIGGPYAWLFWLTVALLFIAALIQLGQVAFRRYSLSLIFLVAVLVNLAAIGKRDVIIVPSQTHGTVLPYLPGFYAPTWVETSIILGLFALGTFLFFMFLKVFPIMEVPENAHGGE